jgi:hypothetical protein
MTEVPFAKLIGVISLAPTSQGFMLPVFFAPQHSNSLLVQVITNSTLIKGFRELVSEEKVIEIHSTETLGIGDEAMWAFQIRFHDYVVAKAYKFRAELLKALSNRHIELEPYVRWEVERIFGDEHDRKTALANLYNTLDKWNPTWAKYWLKAPCFSITSGSTSKASEK